MSAVRRLESGVACEFAANYITIPLSLTLYGYFRAISTRHGKFRDGHDRWYDAGFEGPSVRIDGQLVYIGIPESSFAIGLSRQSSERSASIQRLETFRHQYSFRAPGGSLALVREERFRTSVQYLFRR